jgi:hypothetical protein
VVRVTRLLFLDTFARFDSSIFRGAGCQLSYVLTNLVSRVGLAASCAAPRPRLASAACPGSSQRTPSGVLARSHKYLTPAVMQTILVHNPPGNQPRYENQEDLENVDPGRGYVLACSQFDGDAVAEFRDTRRTSPASVR